MRVFNALGFTTAVFEEEDFAAEIQPLSEKTGIGLFVDGSSLRTIRRFEVLVTAGSVVAALALKFVFASEAEAIPEAEIARPDISKIANVLVFMSSPLSVYVLQHAPYFR